MYSRARVCGCTVIITIPAENDSLRYYNIVRNGTPRGIINREINYETFERRFAAVNLLGVPLMRISRARRVWDRGHEYQNHIFTFVNASRPRGISIA